MILLEEICSYFIVNSEDGLLSAMKRLGLTDLAFIDELLIVR